MSKKIKKVLFISHSGIGNLLMHAPAIHLLKKEHPNWIIVVWLAPHRHTARLAKAIPDIDLIIKAPLKRSLAGHLYQAWQLHQAKYDIGLVLYPGQHLKSAFYLWLAGIKKRVGHYYHIMGDTDNNLFLNSAVRFKEGWHDIEQNINLLTRSKLIPASSQKHYYTLSIPDKYHQLAESCLHETNITQGKPLAGLHAGSNSAFAWKRWPADNFAQVGRSLVKRGYHVLLFGDKNEMALNKIVRNKIGKHHASIIATKLLTTAAIINKCDLFIANDTGLMHIAAALGIKTFGIFGPTDEARTGPRGPHSIVIRAPGTQPVYDVNFNYNLGSQPHESLAQLTPQMVINQILKLSE